MQHIQDQAPVRCDPVQAPIHGSLGWDSIHYAVDGCFYFYRFEACRHSDPAIDLGGFAADLLRFTLTTHDSAAYRICRDDLLTSYNAGTAHQVQPDDLLPYIALAIGERVREGATTSADAQQLLATLDALGGMY